MLFYEPTDRGALKLNPLNPYTLYAFYLTTLMVNSPGAKGGMSKIVYERTKFSHPGQPRIRKIESQPTTITLEWEPPLQPNGEVTHYMITYVAKRDVLPRERNYCDEPPTYGTANDKPVGDTNNKGTSPWVPSNIFSTSSALTCAEYQCCPCLLASATNSTGKLAPDQQAVYGQREKAAFENAIHNIIFVSSRRKKRQSGFEPNETRRIINMTSVAEEEDQNVVHVPITVNVTGLNYTITNLHHFTS